MIKKKATMAEQLIEKRKKMGQPEYQDNIKNKLKEHGFIINENLPVGVLKEKLIEEIKKHKLEHPLLADQAAKEIVEGIKNKVRKKVDSGPSEEQKKKEKLQKEWGEKKKEVSANVLKTRLFWETRDYISHYLSLIDFSEKNLISIIKSARSYNTAVDKFGKEEVDKIASMVLYDVKTYLRNKGVR